MKTVKLTELDIRNFKGIQKFTLDAGGASCEILGDNGTGKSSVCDAWHWLLFGKNSLGETAFEIKPLGKDGKVKNREAETSVCATIDVDGETYKLTRVYYEKWSRKRGAAEATYDGNTTDFYVDDVPVKKSEFAEKVEEIIAPENVFYLLTNLFAFSEGLNWQGRRSVLYEMCGVKADAELAAEDERFRGLAGPLGKYAIEEYKKRLTAERKSLNGEAEKLPARIDELANMASGLRLADYDKAAAVLDDARETADALRGELARIENGSEFAEAGAEVKRLDQEYKALAEKNEIFRKSQLPKPGESKHDVWRARMDAAEREFLNAEAEVKRQQRLTERTEAKVDDLRTQWKKINAEKFNGKTACPVCGRAYDDEAVATAKKAFEKDKAARLEAIVEASEELKKELALDGETIDELQEKYKTAADEMLAVKEQEPETETVEITDLPGFAEDMARLEEERKSAAERYARVSLDKIKRLDEIQKQLDECQEKIDAQNKILAGRDVLKQTEARINELRDEEKKIAGELGENEKNICLCEDFMRYKVSHIEKGVNEHFKLAQFKLFDIQVNGGLADCCEATYNGIPYRGLNHGMQVNIGIDIIRGLSEFYGVNVPLFIDNAESVTDILYILTQEIILSVSNVANGLRVIKYEGE